MADEILPDEDLKALGAKLEARERDADHPHVPGAPTTMEAAWAEMQRQLDDVGIRPVVSFQLRRSFYAGGMTLFDLMTTAVSEGEGSEGRAARMKRLHDETLTFLKAYSDPQYRIANSPLAQPGAGDQVYGPDAAREAVDLANTLQLALMGRDANVGINALARTLSVVAIACSDDIADARRVVLEASHMAALNVDRMFDEVKADLARDAAHAPEVAGHA